jgi:hypothetical protein
VQLSLVDSIACWICWSLLLFCLKVFLRISSSLCRLSVTKGSGPVQKHRKSSLLVGRMVMGVGIEVEVCGVCTLVCNKLYVKWAIRFTTDVKMKEGKMGTLSVSTVNSMFPWIFENFKSYVIFQLLTHKSLKITHDIYTWN